MPYWDEVWPLNTSRLVTKPLYRWKILSKIRGANFKIAIQPTYSRVFMQGDSIVKASMASYRIGSIGDKSNISINDKKVSDLWYTHLLPSSQEPMMEIARNAEFISLLANKKFPISLPRWPNSIKLTSEFKIEGAYVVIFPGASWVGKRWQPESFIEICSYLNNKYGLSIVICGGNDEREIGATILSKIFAPGRNLCGKTTLPELMSVIRGARLLISNDTSAIHIASAVEVQGICIVGGGHYGRFLPYPQEASGVKPIIATFKMPCFNCNWICSVGYSGFGPVPCVSNVQIDPVKKLIASALAPNESSHIKSLQEITNMS